MKTHRAIGYGYRSRLNLHSEKVKRAVKDRTRELENAQELLRRNAELSTLLKVSRTLLKSYDINDLLERVLQGAIALVPSKAGALFLIDPEKKIIELASFYNIEKLPLSVLPQTSMQMHFEFDNFPFPIEDPRLKALSNLSTVSDLLNSDRDYNYENGLSEEIQGIITVLLRGMDGVLGFIILINNSEGEFTDEDARFLLAFSNEAAVIIENFRIHSSLVEKEREVQTQRRLAIIGEMSAQIAHEIRNPLQKILTGVEYLRDYCEPGNETIIDVVSKGVSSINEVITRMVEYGRTTSLNLQEIDINNMVEGIISGIRSRLNSANIKLTKDFPEKGRVALDPVRFRHALQNIMDNAIDAMPTGGNLKFSMRFLCEERNLSSKTLCTFINPSSRLEIKISDTGTGMGKEAMEKLFTPFYTTKVRGSGLGMAMVKKIVDLHKGEISINSKIGSGTEVTIRIPMKNGT
ncbi:MAG: ATP-binding protein [Deltaproteobacteria bacterium]